MNILSRIKQHKVLVFLLFVICLLVLLLIRKNNVIYPQMPSMVSSGVEFAEPSFDASYRGFDVDMEMTEEAPIMQKSTGNSSTVAISEDRMQIYQSFLSVVVEDVAKTLEQIKTKVAQVQGFIVTSEISNPEDGSNGSITLRVPKDEFEDMRAYIRSIGVKVVAEQIEGTDITDEYQDISTRLRILEKNQARIEEIMEQATEIPDIMQAQERVFELQQQIDTLKGRQQYLEKEANMSKITVYMSSDEYALPYVPDNSWRPKAIFKNAVRSLVTTFQDLGSLLIWLIVYAVIWVPAGIIGYVVYKRRRK